MVALIAGVTGVVPRTGWYLGTRVIGNFLLAQGSANDRGLLGNRRGFCRGIRNSGTRGIRGFENADDSPGISSFSS